MKPVCLLLMIFLIISCQQTNSNQEAQEKIEGARAIPTSTDTPSQGSIPEKTVPLPPKFDYDTTQWYDLSDLDPTIILDLRYATTDNFVKEVMYDCGRCFLRKEVAKAVIKAHQGLKKQGYGGLKMFDCYRPRPIQWKLWNKVPNPQYVADPRKGSQHNRGSAVDLTIVDANGEELDMGTGFDFFGKEAHTDYTGHSADINANRELLKASMLAQGLRGIRTEWWHYSYRSKRYEISDMLWECQ